MKTTLLRKIVYFTLAPLLFFLNFSCNGDDTPGNITPQERLLVSKWQKIKLEENDETKVLNGACNEQVDFWLCKIDKSIQQVSHNENCIATATEMKWELTKDNNLTISGYNNIGIFEETVYEILVLTNIDLVLEKKEVRFSINETNLKKQEIKDKTILHLKRIQFLAGGGF